MIQDLIIELKKLLAAITLLGSKHVDFFDKIFYWAKALIIALPISYAINGLDVWFHSNQTFFNFLCWSLIANMIAGVWKHKKYKTFRWKLFFFRNAEMWLAIILVYPLLEMIRHLSGNNPASGAMLWFIQVSTLLYPISKIFKNVFIITHGNFPSKVIMMKLYDFERTGDIRYLTDLENKEKKDDDTNI